MNDAQPLSGENWAWSIWVDGPAESLDEIESVQYHLHHTFKDPVRVVKDRASNFKLRSSGWGEFTVYAEVTKKSGEKLRLERWLVFEPAASPGTDRKPRVFISASAVERPLLVSIRRFLEPQGIEVVSSDYIAAGTSWITACRETLARIDLAAFVISSDGLRGFAQEEVQLARELNVPIVPLLIGNASLPPDLADVEAIHVPDDQHAGMIADALGARAKNIVFEDEEESGSSH
jgi:hypothetical protein